MTKELNPDGTPKEVSPEGEVITLKREEHEKLVKELAEKSQAVANLVSEIQELRTKKQLTETEKLELENKLKEIEELKEVKPEDLTPQKIDSIITQRLSETLSKKDKEERETNRQRALEQFKETHKEFSESSDVGGLKMAALQKKLSEFNFDSVRSVEDFYARLESALNLLTTKKDTKTYKNPYAQSQSGETAELPADSLEDNLTPKELKVIERYYKGDKKKFLERKAKHPDYVASLLEYVR